MLPVLAREVEEGEAEQLLGGSGGTFLLPFSMLPLPTLSPKFLKGVQSLPTQQDEGQG